MGLRNWPSEGGYHIYIYIHVCTFICIYIYISVCTYVCMYVHINMFVGTYVCMYVCLGVEALESKVVGSTAQKPSPPAQQPSVPEGPDIKLLRT